VFKIVANFIAASIIIAGVASHTSGVRAQTLDELKTLTVEQAAAGMARTIGAFSPKDPNGKPYDTAIARGNFVEATLMSPLTSDICSQGDKCQSVKDGLISYFCDAARIAFLKRGVIVHQILVNSQNSNKVEFTIDEATCNSLPPPPAQKDAVTLAAMAQTTAKAETAANAGKPGDIFKLNSVTSRGRVVEERFIVNNANVASNIISKRAEFNGIFQGLYCNKYKDEIAEGLRFHHVFLNPDQSPIADFILDQSSC
jgi:hypothetical protein